MKNFCFLLSVICTMTLYAETVLKPGEKLQVKLPAGKVAVGKRLIVLFSARLDRAMKIGGNWYMEITLNGKRVPEYLEPQGSRVLRLVNRTSQTFHGSGLSYTGKGLWNVVSNNSSEEIEGIYVPDDYPELYRYALDVSDLLSPNENSLCITNMASQRSRYLLHVSNPVVTTRPVAELPNPVERGFESAAKLPDLELTLGGTAKEINLPDFPARPDWKRAIRLRARLSYGGRGYNSDLEFKVNNQLISSENPAHQYRLLNRDLIFRSGNKSTIANGGRLTIMHGSKWGPYDSKIEAQQVNWYYLDIDDMLKSSDNKIALRNVASARYFKRRGFKDGRPFLVVHDVEIGYIPDDCTAYSPARQRPKREFLSNLTKKKLNAYAIGVTPGGGLQITFGKQNLFVETFYSYPKGGFNAFLCKGAGRGKHEAEWQGKITDATDGFTYDFSGKFYRLHRTIRCVENAIHVKDKIENISRAPLGMKTGVRLIFDARADLLRKNGSQLFQNSVSSHNYPNANSSIFWGFKKHGIGLALVDDLLRLQCSYYASRYDGGAMTSHLGFDTGNTRTLEWSIYLTPDNDYYDFVNAVRRDWKVNKRTIPGMISWNGYHVNNQPDLFKKRVDNLGASIIIDGQAWFNAKKYHEKEFSVAKELKMHIEWMDLALKLRSNIRYLLQFQTVFSWRNKEGSPDMMGDSAIIAPDGSVAVYARARKGGRGTFQSGESGLFHAFHYPMVGNNYYKYMMEVAKKSMDAGFSGAYFDTPSYTALNYGRFTYDRWDGYTVDLNPDFTIARKYADCCLMSGDARYNIYNYITNRGGVVVLNSPAFLRKIREMRGAVIHFSEGDREDRLAQMHFTTPVMLGQHGGSGKPLYGRRATWKTEEDFMDDMIWKVKKWYSLRRLLATAQHFTTSRVAYKRYVSHHR